MLLLSQGSHHEASFCEDIGPTHEKLLLWRKHNRLSLAKSIIFSWLFPEDTSCLAAPLFGVCFSHLSYLFVFSLLLANRFDPSIKRKPSFVSHVLTVCCPHPASLCCGYLLSPGSLCLASFGSWLTVSLLAPLLSSFLINGLLVYVILSVNWLLPPSHMVLTVLSATHPMISF